jgi:hypothetical protein
MAEMIDGEMRLGDLRFVFRRRAYLPRSVWKHPPIVIAVCPPAEVPTLASAEERGALATPHGLRALIGTRESEDGKFQIINRLFKLEFLFLLIEPNPDAALDDFVGFAAGPLRAQVFG